MKNVNVTFGDGVIDDLAKMGIDAEQEVSRALGRQRIFELAEQAGSTHKQNLGVYQFYTDELEKFAELIVRECLHIVDDEGCGEGGSIRAMEKIKQHFGVEE
jgi:hypothetical protein